MKTSRRSFLLIVCMVASIVLGIASPARAQFTITGGDSLVSPGTQTATVNFFISDTAPTLLSSTNLDLQITSFQGTTSILQFSATQPFLMMGSAPANYIFADGSGDLDNGFAFWGSNPTLSNTVTLNDTISGGGDFSDNSNSYVTVTPGSSYLLASVQVQLDPNAQVGDAYSISLLNDGNTALIDSNGNTVSFTSTSATVLVESASPFSSAVPLPSCWIIFLEGSVIVALLRLRRHRMSPVQ